MLIWHASGEEGKLMAKKSQYSQPFFVTEIQNLDSAHALERIHLRRSLDDKESQEFRLQSFIMRHPNVLPIEEIERGLIPAVPICMELPTKSNLYVDNLFLTPAGDLILVECKLWHNYESRRHVIAQILEYGKEVSTWNYEDLESAVRRGSFKHLPDGRMPHQTLYDFVKAIPDALEEKEFVDEVSKGLKRGRFLLLVVGDGIHEGLEALVDYVQLHAGLHFTIGLVDIAIFKGPSSGFYIQPRVIARTVNIDRGIVAIKQGEITVGPPEQISAQTPRTGRRTTITEEKFYEALGDVDSELSKELQRFMEELEALNIEKDFGQSSTVLRWRAGGDAKWNFGYIDTSGKLHTEMIDYQANQIGRSDLSRRYLQHLCSIVPGAIIKKSGTTQAVAKQTGLIGVRELIATYEKRRAWMDAIEEFMRAVSKLERQE